MENFESLGLSAPLLKALPELGINTPSPIQVKAIPELTSKQTDFIGLAQTGTGKTAAFGLPLLDAIDPKLNDIQAIILAPTRELSRQISDQLDKFSKYQHEVKMLAVYGGVPIDGHLKALRRPCHILIATPGRLIDLVKRRAVNLESINIVVLDEADEMLNMGFKDDIDKILSYTNEDKSTWLFSATMPKEIKRITEEYMTAPVEVTVNTESKVNKDIQHSYISLRVSDKTEALKRFLDLNPEMRGIVFTRTKRDAQELAVELSKAKYRVDALHGDLSQAQRDRVMKNFKSHALQALVATDVAARGIDVNDLSHVFHYSLPDDKEYYTHRSGRTGRAGKKGVSIAFVSNRDKDKVRQLKRSLGIEIEQIAIPSVAEIQRTRMLKWAENINGATPGTEPNKISEEINALFEGLSKEELLEKLISLELQKFSHLSDIDKPRERRDRKDRGERSDRGDRRGRDREDRISGRPNRDAGSFTRFFINLGKKDSINKKSLVNALFGAFNIWKKSSFVRSSSSTLIGKRP